MLRLVVTTAIMALAGLPWSGRPAAAQGAPNVGVVHRFSGNTMADGTVPTGQIAVDATGNVYGTTMSYNEDGSGNVYRLSTDGDGMATVTPLHYFVAGATVDGDGPLGVTLGSDGALYGATELGGANNWGVVYKLTPPPEGQTAWTESILYNFMPGTDPSAPPTVASTGVVYGATSGGPNGTGTAYELLPPAQQGGAWTFVSLYDFPIQGTAGFGPRASLLLGPGGALYGTSNQGSVYHAGAVFRLLPPDAGGTAWTAQTLHIFTIGNDGRIPQSALIRDEAGNLYGTTQEGGSYDDGTVFQLTPSGGHAAWKETVLHSFKGRGDGDYPTEALYRDHSGALYGTTFAGGPDERGDVYMLTPPAMGQTEWAETVFSFGVTGPRDPNSNLVPRGKVLIGATQDGGLVPLASGTLFAIGKGGPD